MPYKIISLRRIIKNNNINTIHAHTQRAGFLATLVKIFCNSVKVIYTPHGLRHTQLYSFRKYIHLIYEYFILEKVDTIVAITEYEKKVMKEWSNKVQRVHSIVNPLPEKLNVSLFTQFNINKDKKIIAMIGSLDERKQPFLFYEIAKKILAVRNDIVFFWIGDGSLRSQVEEQIINDKLTESFIITGQVDRHLLFSYLSEISILLFTSKQEGFPLSILEAMNAGVFVICNNYDNVREIIIDGYNGFLYTYNNVTDAIKIICNVLDNKDSMNYIKGNCKTFMLKYKDVNQFVYSYENIYKNGNMNLV